MSYQNVFPNGNSVGRIASLATNAVAIDAGGREAALVTRPPAS